jgi:hypothetical protein
MSDSKISFYYEKSLVHETTKSSLGQAKELAGLNAALFSYFQHHFTHVLGFESPFIIDEKNFDNYFIFRLDNRYETKEFSISNLKSCEFEPDLSSDASIQVVDVFNRSVLLSKMTLKPDKEGFCYFDTRKCKPILCPVVLDWNKNKDSNGLPFLTHCKNYTNSPSKMLKFDQVMWPKDFASTLENEMKKVTIEKCSSNGIITQDYIIDVFTATRNIGNNNLASTTIHLLTPRDFKIYDDKTDRFKLLPYLNEYNSFKIETIVYGLWENTAYYHKLKEPPYSIKNMKKCIKLFEKELSFLDAYAEKNVFKTSAILESVGETERTVEDVLINMYSFHLTNFDNGNLGAQIEECKQAILNKMDKIRKNIASLENMFSYPQIYLAKLRFYQLNKEPRTPKLFIEDLYQTGYVATDVVRDEFRCTFKLTGDI